MFSPQPACSAIPAPAHTSIRDIHGLNRQRIPKHMSILPPKSDSAVQHRSTGPLPANAPDSVLRATGVVSLLAIGTIHFLQIVPTTEATPLLGVSFLILIAACLAVAGRLATRTDHRTWMASAVVCAAAIGGNVFTRTFSTPLDNQDAPVSTNRAARPSMHDQLPGHGRPRQQREGQHHTGDHQPDTPCWRAGPSTRAGRIPRRPRLDSSLLLGAAGRPNRWCRAVLATTRPVRSAGPTRGCRGRGLRPVG